MAEDGMSIVPYGSNLDVVLYVLIPPIFVPVFRLTILFFWTAVTMIPSSVSIGTPRSWSSGIQLKAMVTSN